MELLVDGRAGRGEDLGRAARGPAWLPVAVAPKPGGAQVRLPGWAAAVAADVDLVAVHRLVVDRDVAAAFEPQAADEEFLGALSASVAENLDQLQGYLAGRIPLAEVQLEHPLALARVQARLGIPQTRLQRSYRVGFAAMWEAWTAALVHEVTHRPRPADEVAQALSLLTVMVLRYQDNAASQVAETFATAEAALTRSRAHVRQRLVEELLRDEDMTPASSDRVVLGYDVEGQHLVVLLSSCTEAAVQTLLTTLRAGVAIRDTLVHPLDGGRFAVWIARAAGWDTRALEQVRLAVEHAGVVASLAEPATGLSGWRAALAQAQQVDAVRASWSASGAGDVPRVLSFPDVGLEVLLLQDDALARRFTTAELGPLAAGTAEAERLRLTLGASLRHGSHVAAAEALRVHEHTVRNRLQKIETLLGHPVAERRTEMQVALRLLPLLRLDRS